MGQGITIHCMKCGSENHYLQGIGFRYYAFLQEVKEDVIAGKFGKEAQSFITDYPDCEFDARNEVYFCNDCRYLKQGVEINMSYGDKSFAKQYRCGKCRKTIMKPLKLKTERQYKKLSRIPCKKCGDSEHITVNFLMWD